MPPSHGQSRAFTLIELLVVITIIVILSSLLIAGIPKISQQMKKTATRSTIGTALAGMELQKGQGTLASPVCHPLAASATCGHFFGGTGDRAQFYRAAATSTLVADEKPNRHLLTSSSSAWLNTTDQKLLRLDDDLYAGSFANYDVPLLYGLRRDECTILAPTVEWISAYRELPDLVDTGSGAKSQRHCDPASVTVLYKTAAGTVDHDELYPDREFLRAIPLPTGQTYESLVQTLFSRTFASVLSELTRNKSLAQSPDSSTAAWVTYNWVIKSANGAVMSQTLSRTIDAQAPQSGAWDSCHRVHFPDTSGDSDWSGGESAVTFGSRMYYNNSWMRYRLRGTSLVDAWGTEILYVRNSLGNIRLISAGPDGCFVVHPGDRNGIETTLDNYDSASGIFTSFNGDDKDARKDNIQ